MSWEPLRGLTLAIYFVERFFTKISPKAILVFFVPMTCFLIPGWVMRSRAVNGVLSTEHIPRGRSVAYLDGGWVVRNRPGRLQPPQFAVQGGA